MIPDDRVALLEDEVYILRDSGEIPEIAYHATLHYLTKDKQGPQIILQADELVLLQDAALQRYRIIVLRDLDAANRDLGLYRGVRRTLYNWQRMEAFCQRIDRDCASFKPVVREALQEFIQQELEDVASGLRVSSVNCSKENILEFLQLLDSAEDSLPVGWQRLCPVDESN